MFYKISYGLTIDNMTEQQIYKLSNAERKQLQQTLTDIYIDVASVCEKHDLRLLLGGGTCLGAVRHKGFIPWDDDLDLIMPRKDYNELLGIFDKELSDKYDLVEPGKTKTGQRLFAKIMKKNTTYIEVNTTDSNTPTGIFIDIFPVESLPDNKLLRVVFLFIGDISTTVINIISAYQLGFNKPRKVHIKLIGFITSIFSYYKWFKVYNSFISCSSGKKYCTIPSGRKGVYGEVQPTETFFPATKGIFEKIEVALPNKYDTYMKSLYGNYMDLPPVEQRQTEHYLTKFSLSHSKKNKSFKLY
jgi:lipopolysaccharide cholinephosphotransferase